MAKTTRNSLSPPLSLLPWLAILAVGSCGALRKGPVEYNRPGNRGRLLASKTTAALPVQRLAADPGSGTIPDAFSSDGSLPAVQVLWFWGAPEVVLHIGEGETVQWVWWDDKEHSVEGVGDNSVQLFNGKGGGSKGVTEHGFLYNATFNTPGEYSYRCHFYPELMKGAVIVKPKVNVGGVTIPWYDGVSYGGASAIIEEGDTVTWQWFDELPHSLEMVDGTTDVFLGLGTNGAAVAKSGFVYKGRFDKPGAYLYLCAQHGETMRGNITVLAKGLQTVTKA